jgi:uncharacterized protein (TIGR03000 family)
MCGIRIARRFQLLCAAVLFGLACSSAAAQAPGCRPAYYYFAPALGYYVPVYMPSPASVTRTATASAESAPTYGAPASRSGQPSYYTEDFPGVAAEKPDQKMPARLRVRLPANAELLIDGKKTTSTGAVREFQTPDLDPERIYSYLVRARWVEDGITVEKSLKVRMLSGNRVTVNFVRPAQERPRPLVRSTETAVAPPRLETPPFRWTAPYP